MKTKIYIVVLAVLALMFLVTACSSGATATTTTAPSNNTTTLDGAKLVQERCTVCHTLSRADSQHLSAADWKSVVDAMIARGAKLTPEEQTTVIDYLAANFGK